MQLTDVGSYVLPVAVGTIVIYGLVKKVKIFDVFMEGAKDGIATTFRILPSLIGLMASIAMIRASGALDALIAAIRPVADFFKLPQEVMPMVLLRPITGAGSFAIMESIINKCGVHSYAGRVAAVMQGSAETTFYTLTLYYGSVGVKKVRHTILCALLADAFCYFFSAFAVRLLF